MKFKNNVIRLFVLALSLSLLTLIGGMWMKTSANSGMMKSMEQKMAHQGHGMTMHHQHQTMNHALGMILDGSNLVMIGQMGMVPDYDSLTVDHGDMMINKASFLWNNIMSGDVMMKMHKAGTKPQDDPLMKYTHELGEAQLKVINLLKKHADMKHHTMSMHHQHILMNHALKMALEGSNMTMTSNMGMAPGIDEEAITHGKMMSKHARDLLNEVLSGDAMMTMHEEGMKPTLHKGMEFTHEMGSAVMKVMSLLDKMPAAM
jgi:hypothetical protein